MEVSAKHEGQTLTFFLVGELDHHGAKGLLENLASFLFVRKRKYALNTRLARCAGSTAVPAPKNMVLSKIFRPSDGFRQIPRVG